MGVVRSLGLAVVFALMSANPCFAQRFVLPIDGLQGLEFGSVKPRTPYLFAATVAPGVDLGRLQFNAVIAPSYLNPKWDLGLGARASGFVPLTLRKLGLRFAAQGEYLPWRNGVRFTFGVMLDAFGLLQVGLWPGYDFQGERAVLFASVGVDVTSWVRMLAHGAPTGPEPGAVAWRGPPG